jgi:hypothetical protein
MGALLFALGGVAEARVVRRHRLAGTSPSATRETCVVRTLPSAFMDQGEFYGSSSVADVIEVSCEPIYAGIYVKVGATQLYNRCDKRLAWFEPYPLPAANSSPSHSVRLDNDGNATVVVLGGPSCAAGESLITAHMQSSPYLTATTAFTVLPPQEGEPGISATPSAQIEGETYSDVATIVQVTFPPVFAEQTVNINASQLYSRCRRTPRLVWLTLSQTEAGQVLAESEREETTVTLDNDGNAFVVLIGGASCAAGTSLIEASLEKAPYTTYTTIFTVEPPAPGLKE